MPLRVRVALVFVLTVPSLALVPLAGGFRLYAVLLAQVGRDLQGPLIKVGH